MSLFALSRGIPQTESQNFTAVTPVDILTATGLGKDSGVDVTQIIIANPNVAAKTITVARYDGTTSWPIIPGKSISANDVYLLECYVRLARGESIRVTPGAVDSITVHVSYMIPTT